MIWLLTVNLAFAAAAGWVLWRWRAAREAVEPVGAERAVDLRLRLRPRDDDQAERWVSRALGRSGLVPAGAGQWADHQGTNVRLAPAVVGDAAYLVELPLDRADDVLAALMDLLLDEGYSVRKTRGRRITLGRGPDRVVLHLAPA